MKRFAAVAAVVAMLSVIAVATASADTPGCVSHKEFRRIENGDPHHRVNHVFDTRGDEISEHGARTEFAYPTCGGATVFVDYANDRVTRTQWVRGE